MSRVALEIDAPVALLRLENPAKLNAFTGDMLADLEAHVAALERDRTVRCVIVTGEGDRAFCAGADILDWGAFSAADFARHWVREGHRVYDRLARLSQPTIAAMNGHAFGGGLELAAACDIRVIAPRATLGLPEARIGIVPGWSGTQRLRRLLPEPVIKEMALFGRRLPAERAVSLGFAAELADDVLALARNLAQEAAGLSPRSQEITKAMLHAGAGEDAAAMIETLGSAAASSSDDREEGVAAFREKRSADFRGT